MHIEEHDSFEESPSQKESGIHSFGSYLLELLKVIVLAGITIGLVRFFLFKPFYVKGKSMEPSFHPKDYLLIDLLSNHLHKPFERGDVIVFRAPLDDEREFYLKRIIGLPGERVKVENKKVIVYNDAYPQGIVIEETYLVEETDGSVSYTLAPDEFFVLGDNRDESFDSRRFGPITEDMIVGRAWIRGLPVSDIGFFHKPEYNL